MRLVDASGNIVAAYTYDPYGNILTATGDLAQINPLRYRGYYYDTELGMYFLNSRYYDPRLGRFINADSYASTGQSVLGHNMFAYCNNNPINYMDATGEIPVLDAFIHREVLKEIHKKNNSLSYEKTCVQYRKSDGSLTGKWGFCDLYNTQTGEVWELKKNSTSKSCRTSNALNQLDNYISGQLLWEPELQLKKPYITDIPGGQFTKETMYCTYDIKYWNENNGILRYEYSISVNTNKVAQTLIIIGMAVASGFSPIGISSGIGLGGLVPA